MNGIPTPRPPSPLNPGFPPEGRAKRSAKGGTAGFAAQATPSILPRLSILAIGTLSAWEVLANAETTYHVAPGGSDSAPGSRE